MTDKRLQIWYDLARSTVRTANKYHQQIAWFCYEAERNGSAISIWHASASIHGHKCQCGLCYQLADN